MNEALRRVALVWFWVSIVLIVCSVGIYVYNEYPKYAASNIPIFGPASGSLLAIVALAQLTFSEGRPTPDGVSMFRPDKVGWPAWIALMSAPIGLSAGIIFTFVAHLAYFGGSHGFLETIAFKGGPFGPAAIAVCSAALLGVSILVPLNLLAWILKGFSSERR